MVPIPWQQFSNPALRHGCDASEHIGQPCLRIDVVELGRHNRVFKSYDDLVDHCCEAWNKLVDQPWRIMSIGLRQWAHEF